MNNELRQRLLHMMTSGDEERLSWLKHNTKQSKIRRTHYQDLKLKLDEFNGSDLINKCWFIMPGIRGIGKTTILSQLYLSLPKNTANKLFLSFERISFIDASMDDLITVLEEDYLQSDLHKIEEPVYLFLDEVQYLKDWALGLKIIYDRVPNIFIVCTGSSAIDLQSNPDMARRSIRLPIYPLNFTEYINFKRHYSNQPAIKLDHKIQEQFVDTIFNSDQANDLYVNLRKIQPKLEQYLKHIDVQNDIDDYLQFGTLPATITGGDINNKWRIADNYINQVIQKDLIKFEQKYRVNLEAFSHLLRLLADSDIVSFEKLASLLRHDRKTVINMLSSLSATEILNPISPSATAYQQVKRPKKYLFISPAMRLSLLLKAVKSLDFEQELHIKARLLEDTIGLYLQRLLSYKSIHYDSRPLGADFILFDLGLKNKSIPIEVGLNKKSAQQAKITLDRVKGKYGIVITDSELKLDLSNQSVFIPLKYFLLV